MDKLTDSLRAALAAMPASPAHVVGLSGGVDSVVLLNALAALRDTGANPVPLSAVHVNHGLHDDADGWQDFCVCLCKRLSVPLVIRRVQVASSGSVEAAAREARYEAFAATLGEGEALLLAQHRDDQLETLLLRLMRGAGAGGLAGMPQQRPVGQGWLYRPLLAVGRADILAWAQSRQLEWLEDSSNADSRHDRNYLRHELLPAVARRWPDYRDSWSKSQALLGEADSLLSELAREDLRRIGNHDQTSLQLAPLRQLSPARQRNLLRHWFHCLHIPEPGWNKLHELCQQVVMEQGSSFQLGDVQLVAAHDALHALSLPPLPSACGEHWNAISTPLKALAGNGQLQARQRPGRGLSRVHADNLEIRYRQGGESIRLPSRPTKSLKKLLQEEPLAPWLRERLPLLYEGERLVCIPGIGPLRDCAAKPDEEGVVIDWHAPDFAIRPD